MAKLANHYKTVLQKKLATRVLISLVSLTRLKNIRAEEHNTDEWVSYLILKQVIKEMGPKCFDHHPFMTMSVYMYTYHYT